MEEYILVHFKAAAQTTAILEAFLMDMDFEGIEEKEEETVASIPKSLFNEIATDAIFKQFEVAYVLEVVKQQNWNAQWESSFEPVVVDNFVSIRASFHPPVINVAHEIIITPKMSFGTGHHATTFLVMKEMSSIDFNEKTVIDFGTGTGVLAILAEKLGAKSILGIDNDEWSMTNALENVASNNCHNIRLVKAGGMLAEEKADVILANINLNVIIANMALIRETCLPGAILILSGLMSSDEEQIRQILALHQFEISNLVTKNNWIAIKAKLI